MRSSAGATDLEAPGEVDQPPTGSENITLNELAMRDVWNSPLFLRLGARFVRKGNEQA